MNSVFVSVYQFDDNSSLTECVCVCCVCFQNINSHHLLNHPTTNFYKYECAIVCYKNNTFSSIYPSVSVQADVIWDINGLRQKNKTYSLYFHKRLAVQ